MTVCSAGVHRPVLECPQAASHGRCCNAIMKNQYTAISNKVIMESFQYAAIFLASAEMQYCYSNNIIEGYLHVAKSGKCCMALYPPA